MWIANVNLVPMTWNGVIERQAASIAGETIDRICPMSEMVVSKGEAVIDGMGGYLLPGLCDMHMHTSKGWEDGSWPVSPFNLYLANGVTTIRDCGPQGAPLTYILDWKKEISEGRRHGPSVFACGHMLLGPVDDPEGLVRDDKTAGFDFVKLYSFLSKTEFRSAMEAARQVSIYTMGHIPFSVGLDGVIREGMDEIAHVEELDFELVEFDRNANLSPDDWVPEIVRQAAGQLRVEPGADARQLVAQAEPKIRMVVDKLRGSQQAVCTTMVVSRTMVHKLFEPELFLARSENKYLRAGYLEAFRIGEDKHQKQLRGHEEIAVWKSEVERALLSALHGAGVTLVLGTDSGTDDLGLVPGFSIHDELYALVDSGLTPFEAIAAGTVDAARVLDRMVGRRDRGTIEVGKRADLVLTERNPLEDVSNLRDPLGVMASGRWYSKDTLERMTAVQ